jgi:hypothetical protein
MPSPFGHILAGATLGLACAPAATVRLAPRIWLSRWVALPAALAALPDADLLISHFHRRGSHAAIAAALVFIVTIVVTGKVRAPEEERKKLEGRTQEIENGKLKIEKGDHSRKGNHRGRWALVLAAAYASHLLLDLLGADPNPPSGIQLLWPFSDRWFISGFDWFPGTERRLGHPDMIATNARALVSELLILGPTTALAWMAMRRRRSRGLTSAPDSLPRPSA